MNKKLYNKNGQFIFGALISYATIAFNILSGLIYTPWMIRTIGDDQYALYTLAISIINLFLIDFGIGSAVTKFLSGFYAEKRYDDANRFMGIVYKVFFAISVVIAFCLSVFYFFIDSIYTKLTPGELVVFKCLFVIVSFYSVISFPFTTFNSVLMANERFIDVKICGLISKILSVALIITCLMFDLGIYSLVLVNAFVNCVMIGIKYYLIRRNTSQRAIFSASDKSLAKSLFSFSSWVTLKDIAHRCIFTIMPTLIASIIGSKEITIFSLAATLEGYVFTFADAVNGMFMPRISKLIREKNEQEKLTKLMINVGRFHVFTLGLIFIGFICIGDSFVNLWMGVDYSDVYVSAIILIFPSLIDTPQQIAKTTLMAKDVIKEQSLIYILMAVVNILLAVVFMNWCGILGAAIAVCISYLIRTVGMNFLYKKHLLIDLKQYFVRVYGRWIVVAVATFILERIFSHIFTLSDLWQVVINGTFVVLTYCLLYLIMHSDVRQLLLRKISVILHKTDSKT